MKYPEALEIPTNIVQQIQISHNFIESYITIEEKDWNSISYYNEKKDVIIVLVLEKFDDASDYTIILDEFKRELDLEIKEEFGNSFTAGTKKFYFDVRTAKNGSTFLVITESSNQEGPLQKQRLIIFQDYIDDFVSMVKKCAKKMGK